MIGNFVSFFPLLVPDLDQMPGRSCKLQRTKGAIKLIAIIFTFFFFLPESLANLECGGRVGIIMIIIMLIFEQAKISN